MKKINFKESPSCQVDNFHKNKDYDPISCEYYDHLEIWAMHQTPVLIEYSTNNKVEKLFTKIKNLATDNGVEYLITVEGVRIRLDTIYTIEG